MQHEQSRPIFSGASFRAICLKSSGGHAVSDCCLLIESERSSQLVLTIEYVRTNPELCIWKANGFSSKVLWGFHVRADVISDYNVLSGTDCFASDFIH